MADLIARAMAQRAVGDVVQYENYDDELVEIDTGTGNGVSTEIVRIKVLTQTEYDALPSSKNSDNILYMIRR